MDVAKSEPSETGIPQSPSTKAALILWHLANEWTKTEGQDDQCKPTSPSFLNDLEIDMGAMEAADNIREGARTALGAIPAGLRKYSDKLFGGASDETSPTPPKAEETKELPSRSDRPEPAVRKPVERKQSNTPPRQDAPSERQEKPSPRQDAPPHHSDGRNEFVGDPRRDTAGRVIGHKANFGPKDMISISYIDEKSLTIDKIEFLFSTIHRAPDRSFTETQNGSSSKKENLQSVTLDQYSGDLKVSKPDGHSFIYHPGGSVTRLDSDNKVDTIYVPDNTGVTLGEVFRRDANGKLIGHTYTDR